MCLLQLGKSLDTRVSLLKGYLLANSGQAWYQIYQLFERIRNTIAI